MANLSKDLKNIFNKYLERKEREKYQPRKESYFQPTLFSGGESSRVLFTSMNGLM